jgi:putative endonuclease
MASGWLDARGDTGRRAEALAADWLERSGFRILARNWRRPEGELDLVAEHDGTCVFVEVRSRTGEESGDPLETLTARKRARVIRAARLYLDSGAPLAAAYRFDVVGVTFSTDGGEPVVVHIPDAFDLND